MGGPQGDGDLAGRQAPSAIPGDAATATIMTIAERVRASGDLPGAISFYRRAIAIDTHLVSAYVGLGECLLAAGYPNEAAEAFRAAQSEAQNERPSPERTSHEVAATRGLGLSLIALNQPVAAIEMLNKANAVEPAARAYSAIGVAEDLLGDSDAADKAYKQGLVLAPDDLDLQNNYGLSQALHGDFDGAIGTLRRVASDSKATARHRLNFALALGLAGRTEDAAQVARIDLDERSVRSNLAYYAMVRALPAKARAAAILRPGIPLPSDTAIANCDGPACAKPALPPEKLSAVPTAPVDAKLLPAPASEKPVPPSSPAIAKPTSLTPPATAKPVVEPAASAEKKVSKPAKSDNATAKAQSTEPAPATIAAKPSTIASAEPPAPAAAPPTTTIQDDSKPAAPVADTTPVSPDAAKPAAQAEEPKPVAVAPSTEAAASNDAKPAAKADDAKPVINAADTKPAPMADNPEVAAQDDAKPPQVPAVPSPAAIVSDSKPTGDVDADAVKPAADDPKPAAADTTLAAADGDPMPGAMPAAQAPSPANVLLPAGPVVKAAAVIPPLPPGKHAWIQIASFRSEQNAQSAWKTMTNGNQDLLLYVPLSVRRVDLGSDKGVYYVLRIGPLASMDQAHDLCTALKDRNITCVVAK